MTENIQTAKDLLLEIMGCLKIDHNISDLNDIDPELVPYLIDLINKRTNDHVLAALESAANSAKIGFIDDLDGEGSKEIEVKKYSILNAYPKELIK